jgi:hypothetical protein
MGADVSARACSCNTMIGTLCVYGVSFCAAKPAADDFFGLKNSGSGLTGCDDNLQKRP